MMGGWNVLLNEASVLLRRDRKSTRLNSSHDQISYAVFCLKKKKNSDRHSQLTLNTTINVRLDRVTTMDADQTKAAAPVLAASGASLRSIARGLITLVTSRH